MTKSVGVVVWSGVLDARRGREESAGVPPEHRATFSLVGDGTGSTGFECVEQDGYGKRATRPKARYGEDDDQ